MQAVNFFFLVDIFTCVLGILILITLMLATQANTIPASHPSSTVAEQTRQKELAHLLDDLSRLNTENEMTQRSLSAAESAPGLASLQSEIADLKEANQAQRQQRDTLQGEVKKLNQIGIERDIVLGLADLRKQIEKIKDETLLLKPSVYAILAEMTLEENRVKQAEAELLAAKNLRDKLWLIPDLSQTSKEPLLITVAERAIRIERFNKPSETVRIATTHLEKEFQTALKQYDPLNFYTVFYVKPSGILAFEQMREIAKDANYEIGYDALEEGTEIIFSRQE